MTTAKRLVCRSLVSVMLVALLLVLFSHLMGWRFEAVLSGSMDPTLKTGGLIVLSPMESDAIQPGDIIGFHHPANPDTLIVHRVTQIEPGNPGSFQTKGDANTFHDAYPVPEGNVVGKVRLHLPWAGHFAMFAQERWGLLLLLVIPGVIVIVSEISKLRESAGMRRSPPGLY